MLKGKYALPIFIILIIVLYVIKFPIGGGTESLRTGLLILENGSLNIHHHYLFTLSQDSNLINPQWLFQVLTALTYKAGGLELINIFFVLIIALIYFLIYKFIYSLTKNIKFSSLLCLIIFITNVQFLSFRPVTLAVLFYFIILFIIKINDKYLFFIPLITIFWVNIHLSFPLILVILGIKIIDIIYKDVSNKFSLTNIIKNKKLQYYLIIMVLSFLAMMINPYGPKLLKEPLIVFYKGSILTLITEWIPTTMNEPSGLIFFIISLGVFFIIFRQKEKTCFFDLLLILCFYFFALSSIRNILWWSITVLPVSSIYIYNFILKTKFKDRLTINYMNNAFINSFILILLTGLIIFSNPYFQKHNFLIKNKNYKNSFPDSFYSEKIVNYLLINKSSNKNRIFVTGKNINCYFFSLAPSYKFISGELIGCFQKEIEDFQLISLGIYNYHELLHKYKINYLILDAKEQYYLIKALFNDKRYKLLVTNNKQYLFKSM